MPALTANHTVSAFFSENVKSVLISINPVMIHSSVLVSVFDLYI